MQITCFQCRQQLDVPEESAGKRVRCPHCSYVIVAPVKSKASDGGGALGLPSMDLDDPAPPVTKVPAQPLPATPVPPAPLPETPVPKADRPEPADEPAPPPSVERGPRRRGAIIPTPQAKTSGSGKALAILACFIALCVGVVIGAVVMNDINEQQHERDLRDMAGQFNQVQPIPPFPPDPGNFQPGNPMPFNPNFPQGFPPQGNNPQPMPLPMEDFLSYQHSFKVQLPVAPAPVQGDYNGRNMNGFEAKHGEWTFTVLHAVVPQKEHEASPAAAHFAGYERSLLNKERLGKNAEHPRRYASIHPGHEWQFLTGEGRPFFAWAYLVKEGNRYHHYLLTAHVPFNVLREHQDLNRFFTSFAVLHGIEETNEQFGQTIFQEVDDTTNGGRRDNEFLSLAVHPRKAFALVAGTVSGQVCIVQGLANRQFTVGGGNPIEQVAISPEGGWLAVSSNREISFWRNWEFNLNPNKRAVVPGHRLAITKDHRLLAATKNAVKAYELTTTKWVSTLDVKDMNIREIALSPDGRTLALCDEKTIGLWQWPQKKLLGRFDAHDGDITALAFSPDGQTLASAGADRTIKLWDVATRTERAAMSRHAWTVAALAFTPDGKQLVSGGIDGMLLVWDLAAKTPALVWAQANRFPVRCVAFTGDGKQCYVSSKQAVHAQGRDGHSYRRHVRRITWDKVVANPAHAEKATAQYASLYLPTTDGAAFISLDGRTIATNSDLFPRRPMPDFGVAQQPAAHTVRIWDAVTGRQKLLVQALYGSVLSPDGQWLAYSPPQPNAGLHLLETATGRSFGPIEQINANYFPEIVFSATSKSLWLVQKGDVVQYEILAKPLRDAGQKAVIEKRRLTIRDGDDFIAIRIMPALHRRDLVVQSFGGGNKLRSHQLFHSSDGVKIPLPPFLPDERSDYVRIRFGEDNNDLLELEDVLAGQTTVVGRIGPYLNAANIHPEGKLAIVLGSKRGAVMAAYLWDLQERRPILAVPDASARGVVSAQFSPDGRMVGWVTSSGYTRIVPTAWLQAQKELLPCDPEEVAGP